MRLPADKRREYVFMLADKGMSNRAIADVIGVNRKTVDRDVESGGGSNVPPDNSKVTGKDGKQYERKQPKPKRDVTDTATVTNAPKGAPGLTGEVTTSSQPESEQFSDRNDSYTEFCRTRDKLTLGMHIQVRDADVSNKGVVMSLRASLKEILDVAQECLDMLDKKELSAANKGTPKQENEENK
jgi:hypothetical protein